MNRQRRIAVNLVGVGALGSGFAVELARQFYGGRRNDADEGGSRLDMCLCDFDAVEYPRNCVSQDFFPADAGKNKAEVIAARISHENVTAKAVTQAISLENFGDHFIMEGDYDAILMVDAVDNAKVRMDNASIGSIIPCLHGALSQEGTGKINWTTGEFSTFHYDPNTLAMTDRIALVVNGDARRMRPCELAQERPLIRTVASFMVYTLLHALGMDRTRSISDLLIGAAEDARVQAEQEECEIEVPEGNTVSLEFAGPNIFIEDTRKHNFYLTGDTEDVEAELADEQEFIRRERQPVAAK